MSFCISPSHSDFKNYPVQLQSSLVYSVQSGNPCTSPLTPATLYYDATADRYYSDPAYQSLANITFFPENNRLNRYIIITNGVLGDPINNICSVPMPEMRYKDFGTPADISVYQNWLLACYPDKNVVVKYDTNTGTNPVGTVVAGVLNQTAVSPYNPLEWLNLPTLVEWRSDGLAFVVYSSGSYKSFKVFSKDGAYGRRGPEHGTDEDFKYKQPASGQRWIEPEDPNGLAAMLTVTDTSLNSFWVPVSIDFHAPVGPDGYETIFIGVWNRNPAPGTSFKNNNFRIYCSVIDDYIAFVSSSLTGFVADLTGYVDGDSDLIRGFKVINKASISSGTSRYKMALVSPRSWKKGGDDRFRYYELQEVVVDIVQYNSPLFPDQVNPSIKSYPITHKGTYRINSDTSGVWRNHVKAEVNYTNGNLIVVVKASDNGFWSYLAEIVRNATPALVIAWVGFAFAEVSLGFLTNAFTLFALGGWTGAGIIVGALVLAVLYIFRPPKQRYVGSSMLLIDANGNVSGYRYGAYDMTAWIENDIRKSRTVYANIDIYSGTTLYSSKSENNSVVHGNWNGKKPNGTLVLL